MHHNGRVDHCAVQCEWLVDEGWGIGWNPGAVLVPLEQEKLGKGWVVYIQP